MKIIKQIAKYYEDTIAYYIECELGLNLYDIINMKKCRELGLDPYKIKRGSNIKLWFLCQEKDYHNDKGGYERSCGDFSNGRITCPYCNPFASHKFHWMDSLAYNRPDIAKMIAIPENNLTFEDCYNIGCHSHIKVFAKCLDCKKTSSKRKQLSKLVDGETSCEYCSDKITLPNKWIRNLLVYLDIDFIPEYKPYYFRGTQSVDIFIPSMNLIIEMDGNFGNHTPEYDYWRDFLNMKYGGYKTTRVNLKESYSHNEFNCLKEETIKSLSNILNLNTIDWDKLWLECQTNLLLKVCELWNKGIYDLNKISNILNIGYYSVREYLNRGRNLNLCDYTPEKSFKESVKKISGINNYNADVYWVIKPNGEYYSDRPLCGNEIYNRSGHKNGFMNIGKRSFDKYIKSYGYVDINRIKGNNISTKTVRTMLKPFNGWQIILLSKEEKEEYLNSLDII